MFNNSAILVTGGTGSFGKAFSRTIELRKTIINNVENGQLLKKY